MAIFIEGCNVDFDGDIIECVPIHNGSGKKCPIIKVNFDDSRARIKLQKSKEYRRLQQQFHNKRR
jgi:hypothetical protein